MTPQENGPDLGGSDGHTTQVANILNEQNQPLPFLDVIASAQTCKGSSFSPQPHPPHSRTYPDATNTTPAGKKLQHFEASCRSLGAELDWIGLALKIMEVLRGIQCFQMEPTQYTSQIGKGCPVLTSTTCNLRRSARESLPRCCLCTCWTWEGRGGICHGRFHVNAEHVTCWFRIFRSCFGLQAYSEIYPMSWSLKMSYNHPSATLKHSQRTP